MGGGKGKGKNKLPARWEKYTPVGSSVAGTRFLPFKVPLRTEIVDRIPKDDWFTPSLLVESRPMLRAVIDLTDTDRYYNPEEFTSRGVVYKKVNITGGGKLPSVSKRKEFFNVVDQLLKMFIDDSDALIGVHCTHGLNRTGYLICKYMVSRMKIDPQEAIDKFQDARGYIIERQLYIDDLNPRGPNETRKPHESSHSAEETKCWNSNRSYRHYGNSHSNEYKAYNGNSFYTSGKHRSEQRHDYGQRRDSSQRRDLSWRRECVEVPNYP